MTRVRIVCRSRPRAPSPYAVVLPTGSDVRVYAIDDDGTERELENASLIRWECEGPTFVPRATIEVHGPDVDLEATVDADSTCPPANRGTG